MVCRRSGEQQMKQSVMSAVKDTFDAGNHGYQQQTNYAEKRKKALKPVIILCIICVLVWWYIAATATAYAYNNVISIMGGYEAYILGGYDKS